MNSIDIKLGKKARVMLDVDILYVIYKEKALSKYEISKLLKKRYEVIRDMVNVMQDYGYLVERHVDDEEVYFLTREGIYQLEYALNFDFFLELHNRLDVLSEDKYLTERFLKEVFYHHYLDNIYDAESLEDDYQAWCAINRNENTLKLVK